MGGDDDDGLALGRRVEFLRAVLSLDHVVIPVGDLVDQRRIGRRGEVGIPSDEQPGLGVGIRRDEEGTLRGALVDDIRGIAVVDIDHFMVVGGFLKEGRGYGRRASNSRRPNGPGRGRSARAG